MIVVDTSVWVEALRDDTTPAAQVLRDLLDDNAVALVAPVRIELLAGAGPSTQTQLRRLLSALPHWIPTPSTWEIVDSWLAPSARAGERFGITDLLIGATASERGARLWSLDRNFARMARLGLVELFEAMAQRS